MYDPVFRNICEILRTLKKISSVTTIKNRLEKCLFPTIQMDNIHEICTLSLHRVFMVDTTILA